MDTATLEAMADKISHRGPDHRACYSTDNIHLAHVRLSIIDLSSLSNQPLWDANNVACIVFNGEIYNYQELRQDLQQRGVTFNSSGDSEVLLNLYLVHGPACLEMLSGIFSFAIWDTRQQELFIARDNYGVKPFYYSENDNGFFFASEIKALLEVESVSRDINYDSLFRSLVFLWSPGEETLINSVKKLKPAHYAIVRNGKIAEYEKFWSWPAYHPQYSSSTIAADKVYEGLNHAVKEQLVSDVDVGAFLSGGLDSSFLVALAKLNTDKKVNCFTIDSGSEDQSNEGFSDDLPYARKVAQHLGVDLDVLKIVPDIAELLPRMIYHLDELQADPAPLNVLLICEQARRKGLKVLLSGAGGDDIFTGYRRHYAVKFERYWAWLPKSARTVIRMATSALPKNNPKLRRIAKAFQYADQESDDRLLSYFYWIDPHIVRELFHDSIKLSDSPMQFMIEELATVKSSDPVERILTLEQKYFLVDHNFNYTDKMSMATGVEVRVPFLDKRVIETASEIPSSMKQKGRTGKWILKKAAEKLLPLDIIYRSKSGFGAPLRTWLKADLAPMVDRYLGEEHLAKRNIFNPQKVQQLIDDDRSNKADYSYPIFALLCFEIWCQQFLD